MINNCILFLERNNLFTSRIAFARAIIALSALLFLLFNDIPAFMVPAKDLSGLQAFNIFSLLGASGGKIGAVIILCLVFTGYYPQLSCFLQTYVHFSICAAITVIDGGDQVALNLSLLLIPLCLLDSRRNQWRAMREDHVSRRKYINVFMGVYYFLIQIQVAVIYLHAAVGKLMKEDWLNGTSLYFWNTNITFGAPTWLERINNFILLSSFAPVITWLVMIFELALFACIFATNKSVKRLFLIAGILFHFLIIINFGLVTFFLSMTAALILYLDNDNYLLALCRKTFSRLRRKKPESQARLTRG